MVAAGVVVYLRERLAAAVGGAGRARRAATRSPASATAACSRSAWTTRSPATAATAGRCSVLVLDLDGFKVVNDTLGHPVGDELLRQVADGASRETVRDQDTVVRQGGDEFCVVAPETDAEEGAALAERIKARPARARRRRLPVSASAGVATFPADATSAELLLAQADPEQRRDKAGRPRAVAARSASSLR